MRVFALNAHSLIADCWYERRGAARIMCKPRHAGGFRTVLLHLAAEQDLEGAIAGVRIQSKQGRSLEWLVR